MVFWEQEKISRKILLASGSLLGITVLVWIFLCGMPNSAPHKMMNMPVSAHSQTTLGCQVDLTQFSAGETPLEPVSLLLPLPARVNFEAPPPVARPIFHWREGAFSAYRVLTPVSSKTLLLL